MMLEAVWFKDGKEVYKVSPVMNIVCDENIKNITDIEIEKFVKDLLSREDIRYCPHGRPVIISISKKPKKQKTI